MDDLALMVALAKKYASPLTIYEKVVKSTDWTLVDGMYEVVITHNKNSRIFNVSVLNENNTELVAATLIDGNSIKIKNDVAINCIANIVFVKQ